MFSRERPETHSKTWKLTFNSTFTVSTSWILAGFEYDLQETQSLTLHEGCLNESLRIMHVTRQSIMCTFSEYPPQLHTCAPMFFDSFPFPNVWFRYSPTVWPQRKPLLRSMDFARLIKQPPHKDFFTGWVMCSGCLCSLSASVQYLLSQFGPHLVVHWADAALRGRKIHRCDAFSSTGTSSWCLAVMPGALTASASVADHGHGHLGSFS